MSCCRSAVAQALPQLQLLDRVSLDDDRECLTQQQGPAAQHIAELQLQAYQPRTEAPQPEQEPPAAPIPEAAKRGHEQAFPWPTPVAYLQGMPAVPQDLTYLQCMQQLPNLPRARGLPEALASDEVQDLADRLAQRLAESRAALPDEAAASSAKQEQRWASMEARLSALLEGRLPLPGQVCLPRAAETGDGFRNENHTSDQHNTTDITGRKDSASQNRQQPVRHSRGCSGCQMAPCAVQQLQVHLQPHVNCVHILPSAHAMFLAICTHSLVMVCPGIIILDCRQVLSLKMPGLMALGLEQINSAFG